MRIWTLISLPALLLLVLHAQPPEKAADFVSSVQPILANHPRGLDRAALPHNAPGHRLSGFEKGRGIERGNREFRLTDVEGAVVKPLIA